MLGAYDMCDDGPLAQISDHRPVSLALAVVVDTSQLPSIEDLGHQRSHGRSRASSDTANAMALAVTQRQEERRRHRSQSLGRIERLLSLQRYPSTGPRAFPLLVCMAFSRFRFTFRGFDVLRDDRAYGAYPQPAAAAAAAATAESEVQEVKEEAAAAARAEAEEGKRGSSSSTTGPAKGLPRVKSWLRLPSFKSESSGAGWRGGAHAAAAASLQQPPSGGGEEGEEGFTIIDHVLILYPMPCGAF